MEKKIKIIEAVNQLSLGGTEYALQLYSKYLNKELFEVIVVAIYNGGERVKLIQDLGIEVIVLNGDLAKFEDLLRNTDVLHWHGDGTLDKKIFSLVEKNKPKVVVQTNVFGYFDNSEFYKLIDYDLYVSKMILVRRMDLDKKMLDNYGDKRKVLPNPVDVEHLQSLAPTENEIFLFKKENNLLRNFIVGRIGRADDHKFDLITLDGFAEFSKTKENARFLLVGATPKIKEHAKRLNILEKLIIFETSSDLKLLLKYYKSLDVFLAGSNIGESFGMVLAEAMLSEVPIVTISTPDKDNAQIELVDSGANGYVVPRLKSEISKALGSLYTDTDLRKRFAKKARTKVLNSYAAKNIVLSFEKMILNHLFPEKKIKDDFSLVVDFSDKLVEDYKNRCSNLFGNISTLDKIKLLVEKNKKYSSITYFKCLLKQQLTSISKNG
ncbi:glycosyltransferase family 4 protein [Flavobacterium fluviatile]|uniref:glycosyltransferase family 4 protein n=1 Tax=Flavobacterium fluviatile TaxID=1862387 RepID=UPI0013D68725|nr:glycosyltransferase family 4 protein [Flavobacterium fluviatile]